jgi:hypothetical protein
MMAFHYWVYSRYAGSNADKLLKLSDRFVGILRVYEKYEPADQYFIKIMEVLIKEYQEETLGKIIEYAKSDRWRKSCVQCLELWILHFPDSYSDTTLNSIYRGKGEYLEVINALDDISPSSLFIKRIIDLRAKNNPVKVFDDIILYAGRYSARAGQVAEATSRWLNSLNDKQAIKFYKAKLINKNDFRIINALQAIDQGQKDNPCLEQLFSRITKIAPETVFFDSLHFFNNGSTWRLSAELLLNWTDQADPNIFSSVLDIVLGIEQEIKLLGNLDAFISITKELRSTPSERFYSGPRLVIARLLLISERHKGRDYAIENAEKFMASGFTIQVREYLKFSIANASTQANNIIRYLFSKGKVFFPLFINLQQDPLLVIPDHPLTLWDIYVLLSLLPRDLDLQKIIITIDEFLKVLFDISADAYDATFIFFKLCKELLTYPDLDTINSIKGYGEILLSWPCIKPIIAWLRELSDAKENKPIESGPIIQGALFGLAYQVTQVDNNYAWPESDLFKRALRIVVEEWQQKLINLNKLAEFDVHTTSNWWRVEEVRFIDINLVVRNVGLHLAETVDIQIENSADLIVERTTRDSYQIESGRNIEKKIYVRSLKEGMLYADVVISFIDGEKKKKQKRINTLITKKFETIDDPYIYGAKVENPAVFFGRENQIQQLMKGVAGLQKSNYMLIGPSRMGKSSLLYQFG